MKKITLLVAAVAGLTMVSCRKDYTCECKTGTFTSDLKAKSSKKDAKAWCDAAQAQANTGGGSTTCTVK